MPPGRPRRGWVDNIRIDFREIGLGDTDWIGRQDWEQWRVLVNVVMNFLKTKTILRSLSPRANYTDQETAACRRSQCQRLRIEGA
jgi:hypothetical protein